MAWSNHLPAGYVFPYVRVKIFSEWGKLFSIVRKDLLPVVRQKGQGTDEKP